MASKSAATGVSITSTTGEIIYDPATSGKAMAITITQRANSASLVSINMAMMHTGDEYGGLPYGVPVVLRSGTDSLGVIRAKVESGTGTIDYFISAKM